jgi:hypothetical protein
MKIYDTKFEIIENLYSESLKNYFEKEDFFNRIKFISDEFDKEIEDIEERQQYNYFKKSCLHKIFKVHERVRLVRHLKNESFKQTDILPKYMYPGLKTYLLLTCFDQLGQDDKGWLFFPNWLTSEKCRSERNEIFSDSKLDENILDEFGNANPQFIKTVYNEYHEIYGVKNSFMNFLRYLIPKEQRRKLLDKIQIKIFSVKDSGFDFEELGSEIEKEKWLFRIRNDYTHSLLTAEKHYTEGYKDREEDWIIWEEIHSKNKAQQILVRESFKKEIEVSILMGIVEIIKQNS